MFKYSLLFIYLLFLLFATVALSISPAARRLFIEMHASSVDRFSWTRYTGTFLLVFTMALVIYQATFTEIDMGVVTFLVGAAVGGKVAQTSLNKGT